MRNLFLGTGSSLIASSMFAGGVGEIVNVAQSTPELIGSVVAGVLSTVIINILKSRYPKLFTVKKKKNNIYNGKG